MVNTGGQNHRWLGNGYFQTQGAELIADACAEADTKNRGNDHLQWLKAVLGAKADGTVPTLPTRWLKAPPNERLELGGIVFEFKHRGGAHTPGDTLVGCRDQQVCSTAYSWAHHDSPTKHRTEPAMTINDDFSARVVARAADAIWTPSPLTGEEGSLIYVKVGHLGADCVAL